MFVPDASEDVEAQSAKVVVPPLDDDDVGGGGDSDSSARKWAGTVPSSGTCVASGSGSGAAGQGGRKVLEQLSRGEDDGGGVRSASTKVGEGGVGPSLSWGAFCGCCECVAWWVVRLGGGGGAGASRSAAADAAPRGQRVVGRRREIRWRGRGDCRWELCGVDGPRGSAAAHLGAASVAHAQKDGTGTVAVEKTNRRRSLG